MVETLRDSIMRGPWAEKLSLEDFFSSVERLRDFVEYGNAYPKTSASIFTYFDY